MLSVVINDAIAREELVVDLDALVCEGARRMLAVALEAEVAAYIAAHTHELDERGHRLVVRNGHARAREVVTGAGPVPVAVPRVDDRRVDPATGAKQQFKSQVLPPWCRKSPKVCEVLPLLYLHGLSSGDFVPALEGFFGKAAGLSASVITRLTEQWQADRAAFMTRGLADRDDVYCWADGPTACTATSGSLDDERLCCLVIVGCAPMGPRSWWRSPMAVADGGRRWLPGVGRLVGGAAAGSAAPRHGGPGGDGRRRGAGAVEGAPRRLPRDPNPTMLGP